MSDSINREKELEAQVQELEGIVQNMANRFGQKVAEYESNMAVLITRLGAAQNQIEQAIKSNDS